MKPTPLYKLIIMLLSLSSKWLNHIESLTKEELPLVDVIMTDNSIRRRVSVHNGDLLVPRNIVMSNSDIKNIILHNPNI